MIVQGQVGPIATTSLADGGQAPLRQGKLGDAIISELHGRYYEQTYRGNIYSAGNQAAAATVALGTLVNTGLILSNPLGSGKNIVLLKLSYVNSVVVPTAGFLALETGFNSGTNVIHTTPATVFSNLIGTGPSGVGLVDVAATLPTAPTHRLGLAQCGTLATTGYGVTTPNVVDVEGSIILPPGGYAAYYTLATNTAAWLFTFTWEEVAA